jgi:carbamoyl-phosphate synthase large subunit
MSIEEIHGLSFIDPWFLDQLQQIVELEEILEARGSLQNTDDALLRQAKQFGFSDRQLATLWQCKARWIVREDAETPWSGPDL